MTLSLYRLIVCYNSIIIISDNITIIITNNNNINSEWENFVQDSANIIIDGNTSTVCENSENRTIVQILLLAVMQAEYVRVLQVLKRKFWKCDFVKIKSEANSIL